MAMVTLIGAAAVLAGSSFLVASGSQVEPAPEPPAAGVTCVAVDSGSYRPSPTRHCMPRREAGAVLSPGQP